MLFRCASVPRGGAVGLLVTSLACLLGGVGAGRALAAGTLYEVIDLTAGNGPSGGSLSSIDGGQVAGARIVGGSFRATFWPGLSAAPVDLHPAGADESRVWGLSGGRQVGFVTTGLSNDLGRAALWSGTAASYVDLHPQGYQSSQAFAVWGDQQAGIAFRPGSGWDEAILWTGTAQSAVSLHPEGFVASEANGVWDGIQVGSAIESKALPSHAMLWRGTADSRVDLHPVGYFHSVARGVANGQQAGYAWLPGAASPHAIMWSGTASSAVDLNPSGADSSNALATNGAQQVGVVEFAGDLQPYAALWSGTPDSFVNLHAALPAGRYAESQAWAIDADGNVAGDALDVATHSFHAIVWRAVPEPSAMTSLALAGGAVLLRRRRVCARG